MFNPFKKKPAEEKKVAQQPVGEKKVEETPAKSENAALVNTSSPLLEKKDAVVAAKPNVLAERSIPTQKASETKKPEVKKDGKKLKKKGFKLPDIFGFMKKKDIGKAAKKKGGPEESALIKESNVEGTVFTEKEAVEQFAEGLISVPDLIAPAAIEIDFSHMKMNEKFFRTLFVLNYPNILPTSWLATVINLSHNLDVSTFYYPIDSRIVMQKLRRKISEFQATLNSAIDEGKLPDPGIKVALEDAEKLQELLAKNEEKYFHYALYITVQADTLKELNEITTEVESTLGTLGIVCKPASLEMEAGFKSTIPSGMDNLYKTRNMSTDAISATFPFVTSNLTMAEGVLFGLNKHNNSLVVFDRFSLENANSVVFAKSGAGKSYMVKLEIYRSLMLGTSVIVIDPEREYEALSKTVGGSYISFSQTGADKVNPFDLSGVYGEGENELGEKKLFLLGLLKIMLGELSPEEKAVLDKAITLAYQEKGITDDPTTQKNAAPLMEDLYKVLRGMAEMEAQRIATRLEMYIKGSAKGVFDRPTTVDLNNAFTVFSLQELSDELRPIAMYMMLDYIWTRVRKDKRKRILVVDEAWYMMQNEDSAKFLYWFAKRARKYYLGVTTITQDVEDFLDSKYGNAIVNNSSLQILLKQNTAAADKIKKVFNLSDGEKNILLNCMVGEGLFFAGQSHVRLQVVSSEHEHRIVSTDPRELERLRIQKEEKIAKAKLMKKDAMSSLLESAQKVGQSFARGDVVVPEVKLDVKTTDIEPPRQPVATATVNTGLSDLDKLGIEIESSQEAPITYVKPVSSTVPFQDKRPVELEEVLVSTSVPAQTLSGPQSANPTGVSLTEMPKTYDTSVDEDTNLETSPFASPEESRPIQVQSDAANTKEQIVEASSLVQPVNPPVPSTKQAEPLSQSVQSPNTVAVASMPGTPVQPQIHGTELPEGEEISFDKN